MTFLLSPAVGFSRLPGFLLVKFMICNSVAKINFPGIVHNLKFYLHLWKQNKKVMYQFTHSLRKTETGRKQGKFLYEIIDPSGNVVSTRSSNRDYVAATICGMYFFGRIDLIGKGDHGRNLRFCEEVVSKKDDLKFREKVENGYSWQKDFNFDQYISDMQKAIEHQKKVAVIK